MIENLIIINGYSLLILFMITFLASFAIPTAPAFFIVSLAALSKTNNELILIILVTLFATISGDFLTYLFAYKLKDKFSSYLNKISTSNDLERLFSKYGIYAIFLSKFIFLALGPLFNYYAAIKKMSFKRFLFPMVLGETVYSILFPLIGLFFRETWQDMISLVNNFSIIAIFSIIGIYSLKKIV